MTASTAIREATCPLMSAHVRDHAQRQLMIDAEALAGWLTSAWSVTPARSIRTRGGAPSDPTSRLTAGVRFVVVRRGSASFQTPLHVS
jgi:hypothetical protein